MALSNLLRKGSYARIDALEYYCDRMMRFSLTVYSDTSCQTRIGEIRHEFFAPPAAKNVKSRKVHAKPVDPKFGDAYLISEEGAKNWECDAGAVFEWSGTQWCVSFLNSPIYVEDEKIRLNFDANRNLKEEKDSEYDKAWNSFFSKKALEKSKFNVLSNIYSFIKVFYSDSAPQDC